MAITERDRRNLYDGLEDALGAPAAETLMQLLPHQPAAQLVTRDDLFAATIKLEGMIGELRGEINTDIAELRSDMAQFELTIGSRMSEFELTIGSRISEFESNMSTRMTEFESTMSSDMAQLRSEVKADIAEGKAATLKVESALSRRITEIETRMTRWVVGMSAFNVTAIITALVT